MSVIEIENLTKDYEVGFWRKRKVRSLDGLTLSVEGGEIFGFLGANGAGKTTTMKLLMRLIYPTAGRARILGRDINDVSMHARIGYLPENPYFYDYLTARELLNYCAELFGYKRLERNRRTEELLSRVHLDEKSWDKQLRKYSKGMLQRVGLAQALVNDPEIVFLDEPMSGLDPIGRREVRDLIAALRSTGTTVFMCSHILSDIEVLCDRVAILNRGRLAETGRLEELRERAGDGHRIEITVTGTTAENLSSVFPILEGSHITSTAGGARIEVADERDVDTALEALRRAEGRLISVQPVRQSLEELFVREVADRQGEDVNGNN
ncbi:MAG: type transport system ATP-binding protein [Acidobacteriota bacterium]|jgi:ABC-2 type transport system ATP-binding protein|nr:type transport system ATP-binding protein [Acidobacteriota bacterium]